jgi:sulfonate transport system substrate-binding protein
VPSYFAVRSYLLRFVLFVLGATTALGAPALLDGAKNIVRIGYQKSGAFLLVRNQGTLEKRLEPLGYTVEWKEFSSGPPLLEALNAGGLDIGHSGDAPLIFAQSAGIPFEYIGATTPAEESAGILVPKTSPVQQVSDLKGKRIAFAKGSSSHYLVAKALLTAGLGFEDVKPIYLQPSEARAAFQSGSIDAWAVWDPFYAAGEIDGEGRVLRSGKGLSPHREVIAPILAVLRETGEKAVQDPKGTAAFLASKLGISLAVMEKSEGRKQRYYAEPMTEQAIAEQQEVADTFLKLGLAPKPFKVVDAVYQSRQ